MLGQLHLNQGDYPAAIEWFRSAARSGNVAALNMIGRCYENGWGMDVDASVAAEYYRSAINGGDVWAMFNLADLFTRGCGVARDQNQAFQLYAGAASLGHVKSLNMIGLFYEDGICVTPDIVKAVQCFQAGAEGGDCWAQFNLARHMIAQDRYLDAKIWLKKALHTGFPEFYQAMGSMLINERNGEIVEIGYDALAKASLNV